MGVLGAKSIALLSTWTRNIIFGTLSPNPSPYLQGEGSF